MRQGRPNRGDGKQHRRKQQHPAASEGITDGSGDAGAGGAAQQQTCRSDLRAQFRKMQLLAKKDQRAVNDSDVEAEKQAGGGRHSGNPVDVPARSLFRLRAGTGQR
jgi:hypothetical protein